MEKRFLNSVQVIMRTFSPLYTIFPCRTGREIDICFYVCCYIHCADRPAASQLNAVRRLVSSACAAASSKFWYA